MKTSLQHLRRLATLCLLTTAPTLLTAAIPTSESPIDSEAIALIERASTYLSNAPQYSVSAEVWQDTAIDNDLYIQFTKLIDLNLRRPNKLQLNIRTTEPKRSF